MSTSSTRARLALGVIAALSLATGAGWLVRPLAQPAGARRFVWHGTIDDERSYVSRAMSGGGVPRMPNPFIYAHRIHVDFEYVQEFDATGKLRFTRRHMSWSLEGSEDDTEAYTRRCHGEGSLDLGAAEREDSVSDDQKHALQAECEMKNRVPNFRINESVPTMPPMPHIPRIDQLDEGCSYREEVGSRRMSVWLTPDVDAVVDMDAKPGTPYAKFVPEPGRTLDITAKTVPSYPARFRFVIDRKHTSNFAGYAGNAYVDDTFFKRYHLEHLAGSYTDESPDLIFDPQMFKAKVWGAVSEGVVETAEDASEMTASVTAMDYGAIGQVKVYVKYKCGGWMPARVRVNGQEREALSVPLDEDHNLMADALEDYKGPPDRDDDAEPQGDGTKGDGLTAFEEYRGFMAAEGDALSGTDLCSDPLADRHVRTTPHHKNLFVAGEWQYTRWADAYFGWASDVSVIRGCERHLWNLKEVKERLRNSTPDRDLVLDVPGETRVVNFTLARARQNSFDGQRIHVGPQHGVYVTSDEAQSRMPGMLAYAFPTQKATMGSPQYTAAVVVSLSFDWAIINANGAGDNEQLQRVIRMLARAITHEVGHSVGIPHHSDTRDGSRLRIGILDVIPALSPIQAKGLPMDSPDAESEDGRSVDALLIEPGPGCKEADPDPAYRNGAFAGCLATRIVRRGQQESGDVECPMRYWFTDYYELPGGRAVYRGSDTVTYYGPAGIGGAGRSAGSQPGQPARQPQTLSVDIWGGQVLRWDLKVPGPGDRQGSLCESPLGTGENHRPDYWNLAGDAGRPQGCRQLLVINDHGGQ